VPEKKADYNKGLAVLLSSKSPQSQALGNVMLADMFKTQKLGEGEQLVRLSPSGAYEAVGGMGGVKLPNEIKSAAIFLGLQNKDPNTWTAQERTAIENKANDYKRSGAQNINVNTEQTYGGALAKGAADQDLALKSVADNASTVVSNVARQKKILESGNLFTGKTANVQQELASYADAIGLGGKDTATKASNTQSAISGLATVTLDSIKTSGLGAGQGFTDKDREFLQDAKSGRITWNKESIKRVYDLQEQVAIASAKKWNQRIKQLPTSATKPLGWGEVQVPTAYGTSNVRNEADAILGGSNR
jgi:hypothetical protein